MKEQNYEQDIRININALDDEWLNQPALYMKYSEFASKAKHEMDQAKEELDVTKAETDLAIRENSKKYTELEKITESVISSLITLDQDVRNAVQKFNQAKHDYDILNSAVWAFEQRKTALENLVKLLGQEYFSAPKEPRNHSTNFDSKAKETRSKKVRDKVRGALND